MYGTDLIYFLFISVLCRWPCQTSHPNSWLWCWHAITWKTMVAGITGCVWEMWHSCYLQQVTGICSNEYRYIPFFKCDTLLFTFSGNLFSAFRDWSKSTGGGGGVEGAEHFEMWWLENTWPTPSNWSKTEWPTPKWRLKITWPTPYKTWHFWLNNQNN